MAEEEGPPPAPEEEDEYEEEEEFDEEGTALVLDNGSGIKKQDLQVMIIHVHHFQHVLVEQNIKM